MPLRQLQKLSWQSFGLWNQGIEAVEKFRFWRALKQWLFELIKNIFLNIWSDIFYISTSS